MVLSVILVPVCTMYTVSPSSFFLFSLAWAGGFCVRYDRPDPRRPRRPREPARRFCVQGKLCAPSCTAGQRGRCGERVSSLRAMYRMVPRVPRATSRANFARSLSFPPLLVVVVIAIVARLVAAVARRGVDAPQIRRAPLAPTLAAFGSPRPRPEHSQGLTQNLGQLYGSDRDFQSKFRANLRILGSALWMLPPRSGPEHRLAQRRLDRRRPEPRVRAVGFHLRYIEIASDRYSISLAPV